MDLGIGNYMRHRHVLILGLSFALSLLAIAAPDQTDPVRDPIVGDWIFHGKHHVTIAADGSAKYANSGMQGKWWYVPRPVVERKYEIVWDGGVYIDTFILSNDQKHLDGTNKDRKHVHAERAMVVPSEASYPKPDAP
jgi:hypothetical protein